MPIVMARVDERLVHGQVAASWMKEVNANYVIVVDNLLCNDTFQVMLLEMAIGTSSAKLVVASENNAPKIISENMGKRIFLVTKSPKVYLNLLNAGVVLPSVNIGGIYPKPGRRQLTTSVHIDDEIQKDLLTIHEKFPDVRLYIHQVPRDKEFDILKLL